MGYFILDGEGSIADLNFTGAELLGEKRFSLINSNFKVFLDEPSKRVFNSFFKKLFASNSREACELVLSCNDKPLCRVYAEGVVTGDDRQCLLSLIDISEFRK